jgi:hypothetical protein
LAIFQSPFGQKLIFFPDIPRNSVWKSAITYFFGPLIRVLGGIKGEKVHSIGDFDKNTKNSLKSSFLSFIHRETAQNDEN